MRRKRIALAAIAVMLYAGIPLQTDACTSFAVYGDQTVYGMNWDYPSVPAYIHINEVEDSHRVFYMTFETEYGMATNASMNDKGFLSLTQDLYPAQAVKAAIGDDSIEDIHDLAGWMPYDTEKADRVREFVEKTPIGTKYFSLHSLFADKQGDAFVLEEWEGCIQMTDIDGSYMVMTNFPNHVLKEQGMDAVEQLEKDYIHAIGVDRYQTAEAYIRENFDSFDMEKGFEVLSMTAQYLYYPTQISFVFDPDNAVVYLSFQTNYGQIWRVSIEQGLIETYRGFNEAHRIPVSHEGIPIDELMGYELQDIQSAQQPPADTQPTAPAISPGVFAGILLIVVGMGLFFIIRRKKMKRDK